ncbi:MAG TPA: GxxExxY protein [Candidatus Moranbacteria bacterium]|nr:GxxExxY protein [Candidatus Moranbacteria bacterium]
MPKLIYPDLSYKIVGILFGVYNAIGSGYQEKHYQRAVKKEFLENDIKFTEQAPVTLYYKGDKLGAYYFDFIVENKIVLELKCASKFYPKDIKQVLGYLKAKNLDLGILACFGKNGLIYKRILKGN